MHLLPVSHHRQLHRYGVDVRDLQRAGIPHPAPHWLVGRQDEAETLDVVGCCAVADIGCDDCLPTDAIPVAQSRTNALADHVHLAWHGQFALSRMGWEAGSPPRGGSSPCRS